MRPGDEGVFQGRTLIISDVDPTLAFGKGSYLHELLLALGGHNATEASGYPTYTFEDVVRLDPEAIVIVKYNVNDDVEPLDFLGALAQAQIKAVDSRRVAVLTHPDAILPSTGLIGVAEELRKILVSFAASKP